MVTSDTARRRPLRRAFPWFLAAALVSVVGIPGAAYALHAIPSAPEIGTAHYAAGTTSSRTFNITLSDAPAYTPRSLTVNVRDTITLHLLNNGTQTHTFTLSPLRNFVLPTSWTPGRVDAFFRANGTIANVSVAPGANVSDTFVLNSSIGAGAYQFVSIVPYQYQAGMSGTLLVQGGPGLSVQENTTDMLSFVPDLLNATPAFYPATLDVQVTNQGSGYAHTFTVSPLSNVTLTSAANYTQIFTKYGTLANVQVPASAVVWANFTVYGPGVYEYICEPHFSLGMYGFLYVGVAPPVPPAPLSSAIVAVGILIGAGVLLGIGVAIAAVASFTGRVPPKAEVPGPHH